MTKFEPRGHRLLGSSEEGPVRVVSDAEEIALGRRVRLISLNPGVSPSSPLANSVRNEAKRLARFDHPAIPKVLSFTDDGSELWFTITARGERPLATKPMVPLSRNRTVEIAFEVASALEHVHERGCVHGELTLSCLSLSESGQLVIDGAGRSPEDSSFEPLDRERPLGLAPEVTLGEPPSPSADLFCLGAVIYELVTGRPPFGNPLSSDYPKRLRHEHPAKLGAFGIDEGLERFCFRCLAKTPPGRPASAREAVRELGLLAHPAESAHVRAPHGGPLDNGPEPPRPARRPFPRVWIGAPLVAVGLGLGVLVGRMSRGDAPSSPAATPRLLSTAEDALLLRVVATPWAHVYVDGAHLETTPFATPLRLTPGKHEVELRHPNAAPERRTIDGTAGQAVLLDVAMHTSALSVTRPPEVPAIDTTP